MHLNYQKSCIEYNAEKILRNTALLKSESFETSLAAMRYQIRVVGNAILLNHTVSVENANLFLAEELKRPWLDGIIVFNEKGDFVASQNYFPIENTLDPTTVALQSFRENTIFKNLRREDIDEDLFYWSSQGSDSRLTGFVFYRAIRDPLGRFLGGVMGILRSHTLDDMFKKMQGGGFELGPNGAMAVFDRDHAIQLARMGANTVKETPQFMPQLINLLEHANATAQVRHYISPVDKVPRVGVFIKLNDRGWVLAVGESEKDILHGWYIQVWWTVIAIFLIAITQWLLLHYIHANAIQKKQLDKEARHDPLTGLANRRNFFEWAGRASALARRQAYPLSVLSMDLDYFKKINDTYGHDGGDAVLRFVGRILPKMIRSGDIAVRFGGEEFIIAMPHTDLAKACDVAERIRTKFEGEGVEFCGQIIRFTASLGVAQMTSSELAADDGIQATLSRADRALYQAKKEGRNCFRVA